MKATISSLLFAGGLLASPLALATTATYQFCSDSGSASSCQTGGSATVISNYSQTKYPLVMAHGLLGFSSLGGPSGVQYFYGISNDLTKNGAKVFDTQVASFESSYVRGEQLLSQVQQVLAITGTQKVNLIGHSQGVMDSRYVAAIIPHQVASVTGVAGVNLGSPVADKLKSFTQTPVIGGVITPVLMTTLNTLFQLVDTSSGQGYNNNAIAALNQLTTANMAVFNTQFPQGMPTTTCGQGPAEVNGVHYYSWGGTGVVTNLLDPSDYVLALASTLIPGPSDGLVPRCSTHLGQVLRDNYPQNHGDEINQVMGLVDVFAVSPVVLYRQQANRLKLAGL